MVCDTTVYASLLERKGMPCLITVGHMVNQKWSIFAMVAVNKISKDHKMIPKYLSPY